MNEAIKVLSNFYNTNWTTGWEDGSKGWSAYFAREEANVQSAALKGHKKSQGKSLDKGARSSLWATTGCAFHIKNPLPQETTTTKTQK